jgi:NAD(P)-dependent dehydrogenase (short-subunit alcohol dehydrogenase family)
MTTDTTQAAQQPRTLKGATVLITGASRGLGRAAALAFARAGANLVLNSRAGSARLLEETAALVREQGAQTLTVSADLAVRADVERLAADALARFGRVDVLINNASSLGPTPLPLLADASYEAVSETLAANLLGPFLLTRELLGPMLARGDGLVIAISSDAAVEGYPGWGVYGLSKSALDGMTRVWAAELEGTGVAAVAVDPGSMNTEMHRLAEPDEDPSSWADPATVAPVLLRIARAPRAAVNGRRFVAQDAASLAALEEAGHGVA